MQPEFGQVEQAEEVPTYVVSEEVEAVALRLIHEHPRFAHLDPRAGGGHRLGFLLLHGKKPEGKGGLHVLAKAVKAPGLWADVGEYDAVVWANQKVWVQLTEQQRSALIAHELCHLGETSKGKLDMLDHDIEEFAWVARKYGQWHQGLEAFAEQLGLGMDARREPPQGA